MLQCPACGWTRTVPAGSVKEGQPVGCVLCGNSDLWRQKDFPQRLGLLMVVSGALGSSIAWYFYMPRLALGILMSFALIDMLLYLVMSDVLVCYRCQARHSGIDIADRPGFDHETAERYRHEKLRVADSGRTARS